VIAAAGHSLGGELVDPVVVEYSASNASSPTGRTVPTRPTLLNTTRALIRPPPATVATAESGPKSRRPTSLRSRTSPPWAEMASAKARQMPMVPSR